MHCPKWALGSAIVFTITACKTTDSSLKNANVAQTIPLTKFETKPPGEDAYVNQMIQAMIFSTKKVEKFGYAPRASAQKTHGCLLGEFEVLQESQIEAKNRKYFAGLFQPGDSYKAWVRFSNSKGITVKDGVPTFSHDSKPDGRNMSVKLMNVPSKDNDKFLRRISTDEEWAISEHNTFDFELINYPAFFSSDMKNMVELSFTAPKPENFSSPEEFKKAMGAFVQKFKYNLAVQEASKSDGTLSPLDNTYHSMTPYLLVDDAVKYSFEPVSCSTGAARQPTRMTNVKDKERDYLRKAMKDHIATKESCFGLNIHVRQDNSLPIEDPTVIWTEDKAPKVRMATLRFSPQEFDSDKQMYFCENLAYTIWNSLPPHQPLGGINRARLQIYKAVSTHRIMGENKNKRFEPTGDGDVERFPVPL